MAGRYRIGYDLPGRKPVSAFGYETSWFIPYTGLCEAGPRAAAYLDFIHESFQSRPSPNIEAWTYLPDVFYSWNQGDRGWGYFRHVLDSRSGYPEVSFTVVSHIATRILGIEPDAPGRAVTTLGRLPPEVAWAQLEHVRVGESDLLVRHEDGNRTTTVVHGAEVHPLRHTLVEVLKELDKPEPDFRRIANQIERSVDLSYKMLRSVNTVYQKGRHTIQSIEQAVARIGLDEMRRWSYLMLLRELQTSESKELIKQSVIRGKMMELIAAETLPHVTAFDAFITGIFSSLDVILDETMHTLVSELPVEPVVKAALLGEDNELRGLLDTVLAYEQLTVDVDETMPDLSRYYVEAIRWSQTYDAEVNNV
ncbi:EAL and HDOD domain-containing protein [Exiguobacterium chiriqhucha]|uniref:EAL and HDOD domain-containing protein n=1 Tax=Exiguobacterium chiriqhucha TaxID=1385984 RepID=UPI0023F4ECB8|nr:HDOD domain-containing protein [Exiguobacterium chiriqhucha]